MVYGEASSNPFPDKNEDPSLWLKSVEEIIAHIPLEKHEIRKVGYFYSRD
jgi:hypothetical protein